MSFELDTLTKSKITDVVVLSQKNRAPDANPGVGLGFAVELPNTALTYFAGSLRSAMYCKSAASVDTQAGLEGVEPISDLPNLTDVGLKIGNFGWDLELTGYSLEIDHGMGGPSNIVVGDCVLDRFHFVLKEGGTIVVKFQLESNDVSESTFGKVATLKNRDVQITLRAPSVEPRLDDQD